MITQVTILKDGEPYAEITCQDLLGCKERPEEEHDTLLAGGGGVDHIRIVLMDAFSDILETDVDIVFPEIE